MTRKFSDEEVKELRNSRSIDWYKLSDSAEFQKLFEICRINLEKIGTLKRDPYGMGAYYDWSYQRERIMKAMLVDLVASYLQDPTQYIFYHRNVKQYRKSRYIPEYLGYRPMVAVADGLIETGLIEHVLGYKHPEIPGKTALSKMRATPRLQKYIQLFKIDQSHITRDLDEECVYLNGVDKKKVDYEDTVWIAGIRAFIKKYNRLLLQQRYTFKFNHEERQKISELGNLDILNPTVRRVYSRGSWNLGGRFYSKCWTNMPKEFRQKIRCNDSAMTEWDFKALHPTICYVMSGAEVPKGDVYAVKGYPMDPVSREFFKLSLNMMINAKNKTKAYRAISEACYLPVDKVKRANGRDSTGIQKPDWIADRTQSTLYPIMDDIYKHHAPIKDFFYSDRGVKLQHMDSEIAMKVMMKFLENGIVLLPEHDSFIVPLGYEEKLVTAMQVSFKQVLKTDYTIQVDKRY